MTGARTSAAKYCSFSSCQMHSMGRDTLPGTSPALWSSLQLVNEVLWKAIIKWERGLHILLTAFYICIAHLKILVPLYMAFPIAEHCNRPSAGVILSQPFIFPWMAQQKLYKTISQTFLLKDLSQKACMYIYLNTHKLSSYRNQQLRSLFIQLEKKF